MPELTIDEELKNLDDARDLVLRAFGEILGLGPDWIKCSRVLAYLDRRRNPLLEELLRDPLDPMDADVDWLISGTGVMQ